MAPLKDYIYISDRKLDRFRMQLPRKRLENIVTSLKLNVKILEFDFTKNPSPETRQDMLDVVMKVLHEDDKVGSVDKPKAFFEGVVPFRWGASERVHPPVIFFAGATESTAVVLAGRLKHAVEHDEIRKVEDAPFYLNEEDVVRVLADSAELGTQERPEGFYTWDQSVHLLIGEWTGTEEKFEFAAEKLFLQEPRPDRPRAERTALLGTPIYVARVLD